MQGFSTEALFHGGRPVSGFGLGETRQRGCGCGSSVPHLGLGYAAPRSFGLGDQGSVQGGVGNVVNGLCPNGETATQCIQGGLQQYCPPDQAQNCADAISIYQNIGPLAAKAISAAASGSTVAEMQAVIPLIGIAVSAAVTPLAGAIVVGALSLALNILIALGLFNSTPPQSANCNYVVWPIIPKWGNYNQGGVCFTNSTMSAGPIQPDGTPNPDWLTMETFMNSDGSAQLGNHTCSWQFVDNNLDVQPNPIHFDPGQSDDQLFTNWGAITFGSDNAVGGSWFRKLIGDLHVCGFNNLPSVPGQAPSPNAPMTSGTTTITFPVNMTVPVGVTALIDQGSWNLPNDQQLAIARFIAAFCQVFLRGVCERIINNHTPTDPLVLLETCVQAWNAGHDSSATYTFDPTKPPVSFVDYVIQGMVALPPADWGNSPQGQAGWSQTINIGPEHTPMQPSGVPPLHVMPGVWHGLPPGVVFGGGGGGGGGTAAGGGGTSTTTKVVLGTVLVGGAAAGGLYAYSRYEGIPFTQALRRLKFW